MIVGRTDRPPIWLVVIAAAIAMATLIPVFWVGRQAFAISGSEAQRLLWRPRVGVLLSNTLQLTITVTPICALLGLFVAWMTERTDLPGHRIWAVLALLPLTVPAFIASYSWVSLSPRFHGFGSAVLILSVTYFPLVYLPVAAVLRTMDPRLEESAQTLGLSPTRVFLKVVLPQLRPALLGGCLLVASHMLGEFGAFAMLRFSTFTTAIYDQYRLTFNGPAASLLSAVLVALFLPILLAEPLVRGSAADGRFHNPDRDLTRHKLGLATPLVLLGLGGLAIASLVVPVGTLGYWMATGRSTAWPIDDLLATSWDTIRLALAAAIFTTGLALPIAVLAVRHPGRITVTLERTTYLATSLPTIAISLALTIVAIRYARPIYQTTGLLLIAYAIATLPLAIVAVRVAIARVPVAIEEAARTLGAPPHTVFVRVTLPLVFPGLCAAGLLVFVTVMTELTATLLLAPIGTETLAMRVWENTATLSYGAAAPYAVIMMGLTMVPAYLLLSRFAIPSTERVAP